MSLPPATMLIALLTPIYKIGRTFTAAKPQLSSVCAAWTDCTSFSRCFSR